MTGPVAPRDMLGLGSVDTAALGPRGLVGGCFSQALHPSTTSEHEMGKRSPVGGRHKSNPPPPPNTHPLMWAGERALERTDWEGWTQDRGLTSAQLPEGKGGYVSSHPG